MPATTSVTISDQDWPHVRVTFKGKPDDDGIARLLLFYNRVLTRGELFSLILDLRDTTSPDSKQQKKMQAFLEQNNDAFKRFCCGSAYIGESIIIRMTLRTMFRLFKLPFDTHVCATPEEAEAWCASKLARRKVTDAEASTGTSTEGWPR